MLAYWGKSRKLVRIDWIEKGVVYRIEDPPQSGNFKLPLVENGKNVEQFEIIKHEQLSIFGS